LEFISNVVSKIKHTIDTANDLVANHNKMVANLSQERQALTSQVWKYLLEVELKADLNKYKVKRTELNKAIDEITKQIELTTAEKKSMSAQIRELEKKTTSIQPTLSAINSLLSSFGFNSFSLAKPITDLL